jgi:hypothetical protein
MWGSWIPYGVSKGSGGGAAALPSNPSTFAGGQEILIEERYTPEFVSTPIDITGLDPMPNEGWTFDGRVFAVPVPYQPTPQEILAANQAIQAGLLTQASQAMAPILVSLQLGDVTSDETMNAKAWQVYYRALKLVDVSVALPAWPVTP